MPLSENLKNLTDQVFESRLKDVMAGMGNIDVSKRAEVESEMRESYLFNNLVAQLAEESTNEKIDGILSGKVAASVTYEDPELTPLVLGSFDTEALRMEWNMGLDYLPQCPKYTHLSSWLKTLYFGDSLAFVMERTLLHDMEKEGVQQKLKMRESLMQRSALFHVVLGAKALCQSDDVSAGHTRVLKQLLAIFKVIGADLDVRDVAGRTPLFYSVSQGESFNKTLFEMAKMLLEAGANPNIPDRFGIVPLTVCGVMDEEQSVKLLLEHGADPTMEDNMGKSPLSFSVNHPKIEAILTEALKKDVRKERRAAKRADDAFKVCGGCGSRASKRCTGCYLAWYCSGDCQREDWRNHQEGCKAKRLEYIVVTDSYNSWAGAGSSFQVVRIRISECNTRLHINDKDKTINGATNIGDLPAGNRVYNVVRNKGFKCTQGYFSSIMRNGVLSVHPDILPPETW